MTKTIEGQIDLEVGSTLYTDKYAYIVGFIDDNKNNINNNDYGRKLYNFLQDFDGKKVKITVEQV